MIIWKSAPSDKIKLDFFQAVTVSILLYECTKSASGCIMVIKLDKQIFTSEFESHWLPHSCGLLRHLSKKLSKLQLYECTTRTLTKRMEKKLNGNYSRMLRVGINIPQNSSWRVTYLSSHKPFKTNETFGTLQHKQGRTHM